MGWLLAALLPLAVMSAGSARAQRGVAAPIYQQNLDSLVGDTEAMLARWEAEGWLLRGQFTGINQGHPNFRSPYSGESSLGAKQSIRNTESADLVIGRRLWHNAEAIIVPELTRGFGLSNTLGVASFPNNEAFRLGSRDPYFVVARAFIRQTIDLSYDAEGADDDPMRFAGPLARERITITAGKVSVWDFFDDNRYAHDARTQFLGWGFVGTGAFDYAADARGFTDGAVVEWENGTWAVRQGLFRVARDANSLSLDNNWLKAWQSITQIDRSWRIGQLPGTLRLIGGISRVNSARWQDLTTAVQNGTIEGNPSGAVYNTLRAYRIKTNLALNLEQALTPVLGAFLRLGWNDGRAQNWMYTEMDWSISGGLSLNGLRWSRPNDTVGLGVHIGGLSGAHKRNLAAGGIGFIVGDGRLSYAAETIFEGYYDVAVVPGINLALNLQMVTNPAYNAARGPVPVGALRLHAAF